MDAGEIAQCVQMRDEEWDVLYVTSIAFSFTVTISYSSTLSSRFIQNALPHLNDQTRLHHKRPPSSSM